MINANLGAAVKEAGLASYVNNEKENAEDEKKDRVLLAQLVEAAKGRVSLSFFHFLFIVLFFSRHFLHGKCPAARRRCVASRRGAAAASRSSFPVGLSLPFGSLASRKTP